MAQRRAVATALALGALALAAAPSVGAPRATTPEPPSGRAAGAGPDAPTPARAPYVGDAPAGGPSAFTSPAACEAIVAKRAGKRGRRARIASWNIRWFPDGAARGPGAHATDLDWLACAITALDVQVVAVQEIVQHTRGRAALLDLLALLDRRTGGRWEHDLDDCAGSGRQHVGLLWDSSRVEVNGVGEVAALNPGDGACSLNLRPGFGAHVRFRGGPDLHVVTAHLDSGTLARDHGHRATSLARLADVTEALAKSGDADVLFLGDLNTMGCEDCDPPVAVASELGELDAAASRAGMRRLEPDALCSHYYRKRPALLDHALAAGPTLLGKAARLEVHGPCRELGCLPLGRGKKHDALERLSDHCPLVVDLGPTDPALLTK